MTEIDYKSLNKHLAAAARDGFAPVYLIHGEEMLVKESFQAVLGAILPEAEKSLNFEPFDGTETDLFQVVERASTFSLMPGVKVVALTDARIFLSGQDRKEQMEKAAEAAESEDLKTGARCLLTALALAGLSWEDLSEENRGAALKPLGVDPDKASWLDRLIDYCRGKNLKIPKERDGGAVLGKALEKGLPGGNHLLITTEQVDRRKSLYTTIRDRGAVVNCQIPKGDRRADRQAQDAVLRHRMNEILERAGKKVEPEVFAQLREMTGFDLRAFSSGLEKLIDYAGARDRIQADDIAAVLKRTKKDPVFEFTNAVTDRDLDGSLFYFRSLLEGGVLSHPLQLLGAMVNQVRKLLLIKDFVESPLGGAWQPSMSFNVFKTRGLPAMQQFDQELQQDRERWYPAAPENAAPRAPAGKKKARSKARAGSKTDLKTVPNPKNPYPIYQLLKKSDRFTTSHLRKAMHELARADMQIKTGGGDPRIILERVVLWICEGGRNEG